MSDPKKDWLEEELASMGDLEAPASLLPKVMERVRARSRRSFLACIFGSRAELPRSIVLALSACLLAALVVINPAQYLSAVPIAPAVLRAVGILIESTRIVLLQARIYHLPLLALLVPILVLSYAFLVTTVSLIKRLLTLQK
jgi:hypothetical protein